MSKKKNNVNENEKHDENIQEEAIENELKKEENCENQNSEKTNNNTDLNNELLAKIEILENEKNEFKDLLLRRTAEFENYKRRTENEQSNLLKYAAEGLILKIIPIYDDLDRSLKHVDDNSDSLKEGIKMVFTKFSKIFEEQGIQRIDKKNISFDLNLHEALLQQPLAGVADQTVLEIIEPGYLYKDKVIKHAKVIVSQEIVTEAATNNELNHPLEDK
jgi:molecular chaperone GrpE